MAHTPFLAWLSPAVPRLHWNSVRIKETASFSLIWAVQVAVALLLLPVLLFVLAVGGVGILLVWLTGTGQKASSPVDQSQDE